MTAMKPSWMNRWKRFWKFVQKGPNCWNWLGCKSKTGYGYFQVGSKSVRAHRFIYEQVHGHIQAGLHVLHTCDNPACVRHSHLRLGTMQDNMDDARSKGRLKSQKITHCPQGHEYTLDNTQHRLQANGKWGQRRCRKCANEYTKRRLKVKTELSSHLCECGCGQYTTLVVTSHARSKLVRGTPHRFVWGHNTRGCHERV